MSSPDLQQLAASGAAALRSGDHRSARAAFEQVTAAGGNAHSWLMLAQCCAHLGDPQAEERALDGALNVEPRNLIALLAKGERVLSRGDERGAASFFTLALQVAPAELPPALRASVQRAAEKVAAVQDRFEDHLEQALADAGIDRAGRPQRFQEALDIAAGRKPIQIQQPTSFFYPGLPQTCFFDPAVFGWVAGLEAQTAAIRAELEGLLRDEAGFHPYVQRDPARANREHALLDDSRWSAFDLWRNGEPVEQNARRCPVTMAALDQVPLPRIIGRAPMAIFSMLRARTHIPPHWGMLNTRLICHLPLIVPPDCRLRVGNEERMVEAGKMMIFDDSIQHEAWNDSDSTRVVLLFEIWRPELDHAERAALTAMFQSIGSYGEG
ncbi:aspartyl/asparaginyl beta-hydroxylase domain-containing protein [Sphingomonas sp. GCM10030256]|uniref:aspartyl/asparaginyl beta-hydroxylase domain-containing protein n=1 Tax=Sphingomonas sp. GCM10030256 TaxID=3273427 RepID=UPI00360D16F5